MVIIVCGLFTLRIEIMFQDNPLLAQLKQQIKKNIPKKEGRVKATDRGFGFLECDDKSSYFIPPPFMKNVLHGDRISALLRTDKEKESVEPDTLIEQAVTRFIARIRYNKKRLLVMPDHPQLNIALPAKTKKGVNPELLKEGDWVVAYLIQHPLKEGENQFLAQITEKITDADDKIAPWWVTLAQNDLPNSEPEGIEQWLIQDDADLNRVDMTHLPFVTIDGASTKDMDDALHITKEANGDFTLSVAIADPTAYIAPNDPMDTVARQRGYTIYLPGRNIPMLPRELSDNLCSLIDGEKRPAICCTVTVDAQGVIQDDITFVAAWIRSQARLAYDHVSDYLENGTCENWQPTETIAQQVTQLHKFAQARSAWRQENAVVFPDRPDYRFELSDDNDVIAIHADMRRSANRLVEEAMVTANICAGTVLKNSFNTGVFNTHAGFKPEKLDTVLELVNETAPTPFDKESIATLEGFSALRRWLGASNNVYIDNRIRKMQAYSEVGNQPEPHFAMGLPVYATWTSPIRKYGDMINHRLLKAHILSKDPIQLPDDVVGNEMALHRKHHRMAERSVSDWLYVRTLADDVTNGTIFTGEIFDINRAGMRVRLIENGASAFIPGSLIVNNKKRIECNAEAGTIAIDTILEYKLGDQFELVITEIKAETRSLVAKPIKQFPEVTVQTVPEQPPIEK